MSEYAANGLYACAERCCMRMEDSELYAATVSHVRPMFQVLSSAHGAYMSVHQSDYDLEGGIFL